MNVIPLKFDCQQEHTIQRAASPETARSLEGTGPSADPSETLEHKVAMALQEAMRGLGELDLLTRNPAVLKILHQRSYFGSLGAIALAGRVLYGRVREDE